MLIIELISFTLSFDIFVCLDIWLHVEFEYENYNLPIFSIETGEFIRNVFHFLLYYL